MDLLPDDQQAAIAATARAMITDSGPLTRLHSLSSQDTVTDTALWKLAARSGFFALGLPEDLGGAGLGLAEETLVCRELGRGLVSGPYLGTVLAGHVASAAGHSDLAAGIADGSRPAGLLDPAGDGRYRTLDAGEASTWLRVDGGAAAIYDAAAVEVVAVKPCTDPGSRLAYLRITGTPIASASEPAMAARACVLLAALLSGNAEATRDASAAYARTREQFGAPIGSFQAVKHRCADMAVRAEASTCLTNLAALAVSDGRPDAALLWPAARALAADYALRNAGDNIQNHGAIGMTAEADAHLYLKRAQVLGELVLSGPGLREAILAAPAVRPT
jgi:alkylation response protein AidB-like acyl-CoA dehydrogenase